MIKHVNYLLSGWKQLQLLGERQLQHSVPTLVLVNPFVNLLCEAQSAGPVFASEHAMRSLIRLR